MKSNEEPKAKIEALEEQMQNAKKTERTNAPREVKSLCKVFGFTDVILKGSLTKGEGTNEIL